MPDFKPNIKLELVNLWSDVEARPIKVIKLIVTRKFHDKSEVHLFELESLIQDAEQDQNYVDINFESLYSNLTKREQEILVIVAKGATSVEISEKFYISINTVKNHRRNIKTKLNIFDPIEYSKFLRWISLNIE